MRRLGTFRAPRIRRGVTASIAIACLAAVTGTPVARATAGSTDEDRYRRDVRFRTAAFLRTDMEHIRAVHAAYGRDGRVLRHSVVLAPDEERELDLRNAVSRDAGPVVNAWLAANPDVGAAGTYMDRQSGRLVVLVTTTDTEAVERAVREASPHPDRVVVRQVQRTFAALADVKSAVVARRGSTAGYDIVKVTIEKAANRVGVGVTGDTDRARAELGAAYGATVNVFPTAPIRPLGATMPMGTTQMNAPPFRGGQLMTKSNLAPCVQGFIGRDTSVTPPAYYSISAGHCGGPGEAWYHPNYSAQNKYTVGRVTRNSLSSGNSHELADAMAIRISSAFQSNDVNITSSNNYNVNVTSRDSWAQAQEGDEVCWSVVHNPVYACGFIVNDSADACYGGPTMYPYGASVCYDYLREFDELLNPGDSGSPVMYPIDGAGNVRAAGIVVASDDPSYVFAHSYFGHIYDVLQELAPMDLMLTTL